MENPLKAMLKSGETALGVNVTIGHPEVAELAGLADFDWVLFDTEHAPQELAMVQNLMQAMSFSRVVPIVRVAWNDQVLIKRALDIGSYGIIVPWVNTKKEAVKAVQAVRYPPQGFRGFGPRRALYRDPDYVSTVENELLLCVQIETQRAIDNIDEILSVEGIDVAVVGPADLSLSMGMLYQYDNPDFADGIEKIAAAAKRHNVTPGMLAVDNVAKRAAQGYRMLCVSGDVTLLKNAFKQTLTEARDAVRSAEGKPR